MLSQFSGDVASAFIASGAPVDVMLLDIRMPGKTGIEVMKDALPRPQYPIYAMTGHVDTEALDDFRSVSAWIRVVFANTGTYSVLT